MTKTFANNSTRKRGSQKIIEKKKREVFVKRKKHAYKSALQNKV